MDRKAFTLIELLVVISIIAILLALLTPSLGLAKMLARRAACASQMRSLALATQLYAADHDDFLPWNRMGEPGCTNYTSYVNNLQDYLNLPEDPQAWETYSKVKPPYPLWCPEVISVSAGWTPYEVATVGTSYAANFDTLCWWQENMGGIITSAKRFVYNRAKFELAAKHPTETAMFVESVYSVGFAWHHLVFPESGLPRIRYRHPMYKGMNVCYFDGHVEAETFDFIYYEASQCTDTGINYSPSHPFWYINY